MLAPPPEGTFDIDNERLPIKSTPVKTDVAPEQTPLLAQEEEDTEGDNLVSSSASGKSKVRLILNSGVISFIFFHMI